ncbi:MAG TPA: LLM class flavin-dependent oxidoreductase [Candidatus Dormibacteraeota bacterium]|nr:LLM class flavin-dependent oxidoreductase [Candidatus Dormibacteraeota bacterium]
MRPELGLLILPERPVPELVGLGRRAEELGYGALWVADEKFYRDPWVVLSALARETRRVRLGTGVTEPYARHPALIAMAAATLAELAPGRVVVGLGAGGPGFPPLGVERRRPARALPEAVRIIRGLLAGGRVEFEGEILSFRGGNLEFPSTPLPVYVAARGPRMLAAAALVADGVIVAPFASARAVAHACGAVRRAAEAAGRAVPRVIARVDVCIGRTRREAHEAVRYFVALPVWVSYPDWRYLEALGLELPAALRELVARRDYRDIGRAGHLLPEEMFDHFAVAGSEDEIGERLGALLPLVDGLIVHPVGSPGLGVDGVMERVAGIWARLTAPRGGGWDG